VTSLTSTQQPTWLTKILQPNLFNKAWLRWLIGLWVFYMLNVTGLNLSRHFSDLTLFTLQYSQKSVLVYMAISSVFVIIGKCLTLAGLIIGVMSAYGIIQRRVSWFKPIAFICFFMIAYYAFFKPSLNLTLTLVMHYEYIQSFDFLFETTLEFIASLIMPVLPLLFIIVLLLKYRIQHQATQ